jgi:DNA polymerase iota
VESKNPLLKSKPLGIRQKNILATCNYNARKLGVRKLMLASEAKRMCPDLVLVDGEDLTPFRDVSKTLFNFLRSYSWNNKVERLGFDEVFMDVTDIVDYNMVCLNRNSMAESFFQLSNDDPQLGFACDLTSIAGCAEPNVSPIGPNTDDPSYLRLVLGSHLGHHLRTKLEAEFGYTSTCGISTNKVLSKLVGAKNKPRNQTTLLALRSEAAVAFIDGHSLRAVPGIGFKFTDILESFITSKDHRGSPDDNKTVTARQVRLHPAISPAKIETLLGGSGAEKGVGSRVWGLLHGVDYTEVKAVANFPTQISIEDTYKGLDSLRRITEELHKLSLSLVRRMRIDLLVADEDVEHETGQEEEVMKWLAKPKTLRLSIRSWPQSGQYPTRDFSRTSRSGPLPSFVFDTQVDFERIAERLVTESLLPLLRRFQFDKGHRWNLQLINICVANMAAGAERDISAMFKKQDEVLKPWRVACPGDGQEDERLGDTEAMVADNGGDEGGDGDRVDNWDASMSWESSGEFACPMCGHCLPSFAAAAHLRFHEVDGVQGIM